MKQGRHLEKRIRPFAGRVMIFLLLVPWLVFSPNQGWSHGWNYTPPIDVSPNGPVGVGLCGGPGLNLPGPLPGGTTTVPSIQPNPSAPGIVRGGDTRKRFRTPQPQVTWEHWWARNQYSYLRFTALDQRMEHYPRTPDAGAGPDRLGSWRHRCVTLLRPLLDHDSARLRRGALIGLARLNDAESLPRMQACMKDRNQTVRDTALMALGIIDSERAKHSLLHIAKGSPLSCRALDQSRLPDYYRGFAEISLAMSRTQGAGSLIRALALDPKCPADVRAMALESLGILGDVTAVPFLTRFLEDPNSEASLQAAAMVALGKIGEPAAAPYLLKALSSRHLCVQRSAAVSLGRLHSASREKLVKRLHLCFNRHHDRALRGFALVSMGQLGGPTAIRYLEQVIARGKQGDLAWAMLGLGFALQEVQDERCTEKLLHRLQSHGNRSVRGAAAIALGLAGDDRAVPGLLRMMSEGDDPCLRGYCALALGMIGDPAAIPGLREVLLKNNQPQVTVQAARGLALLKDLETAEDLLAVLHASGNDYVKCLTAQSLVFMGDLGVLEDLCTAMEAGKLDDLTFLHSIHLATRLLTGATEPYLDRLAAGSNFADESPLVSHLLALDV